eukprot:Pgem_evm1s8777
MHLHQSNYSQHKLKKCKVNNLKSFNLRNINNITEDNTIFTQTNCKNSNSKQPILVSKSDPNSNLQQKHNIVEKLIALKIKQSPAQ